MDKSYIHLTYRNPNNTSKAKVVIFSKGNRHSAFISDADDNVGMSLTNSIEYAVIDLSKKLGVHPENIQVFQLDYNRDMYESVKFVNGNPNWSDIGNDKILSEMGNWLNLTEDEKSSIGAEV